jgi:hypothetical protein
LLHGFPKFNSIIWLIFAAYDKEARVGDLPADDPRDFDQDVEPFDSPHVGYTSNNRISPREPELLTQVQVWRDLRDLLQIDAVVQCHNLLRCQPFLLNAKVSDSIRNRQDSIADSIHDCVPEPVRAAITQNIHVAPAGNQAGTTANFANESAPEVRGLKECMDEVNFFSSKQSANFGRNAKSAEIKDRAQWEYVERTGDLARQDRVYSLVERDNGTLHAIRRHASNDPD